MSLVLCEVVLTEIARRGYGFNCRNLCQTFRKCKIIPHSYWNLKCSITSASSSHAPTQRVQGFKDGIRQKMDAYAGQPTHVTHPHVIKKGDVVPNISVNEFQDRRRKLLESIEIYSPNTEFHIVVIPSSTKKYMTEKIPYVFRQDSNFLYFSGCLEPDSVLVLTSLSKQHESVLFLRGRDPQAELWDGPRTGVEQAVEMFGVDQSLPSSELGTYLRKLLKSSSNLIFWYDYLVGIHDEVMRVVKDVLPDAKACESPSSFFHNLRKIKSVAEQDLMRRSCAIGSEAIKRTISSSKPGYSEAQIFARVDYECRMLGAEYLAYPPVVAGGPRANVIHYISNNQIVDPGDLVLMDAGCELHGYTSDITRTWPISGKFSPEQRELYEALYHVQMQLIKECELRPSLNQLFRSMCIHLGKALRELGAISSKLTSDDDLSRAAFSLCPHHVGHFLGMDVHDTASVPRSEHLQPGMVITVEPGLYIDFKNKVANPRYHGIGMRIEDDILVTETDIKVLTADCPKHPDHIESLCSQQS